MRRATTLLSIGLAIAAVGACESRDQATQEAAEPSTEQAAPTTDQAAPAPQTDEDNAAEARQLESEAQNTLQDMRNDANMAQLLDKAAAVLIVPDFWKGAAVVGVHGGEGVLLARQDGGWSSPSFYDIGGISVGAQAGGEGGQLAMVLLTDKALNNFKGTQQFSLDANSGLTIIDASGKSEASWGKGDVLMWSDTEGAFAGASLGASDINFDEEETRAYYGRDVTPEEILSGQATAPQTQ